VCAGNLKAWQRVRIVDGALLVHGLGIPVLRVAHC